MNTSECHSHFTYTTVHRQLSASSVSLSSQFFQESHSLSLASISEDHVHSFSQSQLLKTCARVMERHTEIREINTKYSSLCGYSIVIYGLLLMICHHLGWPVSHVWLVLCGTCTYLVRINIFFNPDIISITLPENLRNVITTRHQILSRLLINLIVLALIDWVILVRLIVVSLGGKSLVLNMREQLVVSLLWKGLCRSAGELFFQCIFYCGNEWKHYSSGLCHKWSKYFMRHSFIH